MGYAENLGSYWRGRYKQASGKYATVRDGHGRPIHFRTRRDAERAANDAESKARSGGASRATSDRLTFGTYASLWYARQDLAASTMQNYRRRLEEHLLPVFEHRLLDELTRDEVVDWQKAEKAKGYADSSIRSWRDLLHLVLADAEEDALIGVNVAAKRRGRGKRTGHSGDRGEEKVITTALGVLLIAERTALLSGRDDEFVAVVTEGFTGIRWGELVGLEAKYIRRRAVRVEWQLYELDNGRFERCPPKDGSRRTVAVPDFLDGLLAEHLRGATITPCPCHGLSYAFRGHRATKRAEQSGGPRLADVARRAGVAVGTASAAFREQASVAEATRARVLEAAQELGYVLGRPAGILAPHWRRNGFATWLFQPAATGSYPQKAPRPAQPVPVLAEPWPGVPVRGRGAPARADACWLPVAPGLTPHGLRHTYKTMMVGLRTPAGLMDAQMGHADGSVQALYSHVTDSMVGELLDGLTRLWEEALVQRRALSPRSPVTALDRLLTAVGE